MKRFSSRYFMQLFRWGLFFGLLPAMVIGSCLYFYSYRNIMRNIQDTIIQSHQQTQMRLEQTLHMQDRQLFNFLTDSDTIQLLQVMPPFSEYFQLVEKVNRNLNKLMIYDLGIEGYILVSLENDWVLTASGMSRVSGISGYQYLIDVVQNNKAWYVDFIEKDEILPSFSMRWILPYTVKLTRSFPIHGNGAIGYASISIPCSYYNKLLVTDEFAKDILVVDENGRIIANKMENLSGILVAESVYGTDLDGVFREQESGFINSHSNSYLYSFSRNISNGWQFIYITDTHTILQELYVLRNITVGLGFLIILGVIITSFVRAWSFYRPVNKIYNRLTGEKTKVGHESVVKDEFIAIDTHLEAILSDKRELEQRLIRQSQLGKELFVHHIINGEIAGRVLDEKMKLYQFPNCPSCCRVVLIQLESLEDTGYDKNDRDWLFIALSNIGTELMSDQLCFPVVVDGGNIVMIVGMNEKETEFKECLLEKFEKFLEMTHQTLHVDVVICISENITNYDMVSECRAKAYDMFKYQIQYGQNGLLFAEDMEKPLVVHPQFPQRLEEDILQALRQHDIRETDSALEIFVRYVMDNEGYRRICHLIFSRLLADILRMAQEYNMEQIWLKGRGSVFEQLFALKNWRQIYDWFKENLTDPILQRIRPSVSEKDMLLIQELKKMAENRYEEYLSIEIIAEELSISPSYLRRVFKNGTNMAFNAYLTQCRMEAAKNMLEKTNMRILDIAKKLTYQNSQNFIRTFHSLVGMTPGEYREFKI